MDSWLKQSSFKIQDEYYTPKSLVEVIIPFLKPNSTIWCPFDTSKSEFVLTLKEKGFKVIYSHLILGQDFFTYEPTEHYDYIISNPPFSRKLEVFDRLYKLNKPFAMINGLTILNYQEIGEFFLDKDLQLLIPDKKVSFDGNTTSFNSCYFCYNVLPKDLIFVHLKDNNSNSNYLPSRMYQEMEEIKNKETLKNLINLW